MPGAESRGGSIRADEIPLGEVDAWLKDRVADGMLVDPKVYTGLYFIGKMGK